MNHEIDIKENNMQLSKFTSPTLDIVVLYRSQSGNLNALKQHLEDLNKEEKPLLIIGDFNYCYLETTTNSTTKFLKECNFKQLVKEPTHIEGNLLDQAHIKDVRRTNSYSTESHSKYYTDHKAVAFLVKKNIVK